MGVSAEDLVEAFLLRSKKHILVLIKAYNMVYRIASRSGVGHPVSSPLDPFFEIETTSEPKWRGTDDTSL